MNHLPVELHTFILKLVLSISRQPTPPFQRGLQKFSTGLPPSPLAPSRPVILNWIEQDVRSHSLFPYNVASVCKLWHDLIVKILDPECWTRVVFDVANDPTPFLDVFLWSTNLQGVEIVVFNSSGDVRGVEKSLENRRVLAIAQALEPNISRCESIIFDIIYSSSLPPPNMFFLQEAPHLKKLALDCRVDDIDTGKDVASTMANSRARFKESFPELMKLSMTGFWFMYLALHSHKPKKWLEKLTFKQPMELYISNFKFLDVGHYTLPKFVSYLSKMHARDSIYFRDLSLSYAYHNSYRGTSEGISLQAIHFQSVSKDFLAHFSAIANIFVEQGSRPAISFEGCEIPRMQILRELDLTLKNIIDGQSLRHVFKAWSGSNVEIHSCPAFNDDFLSWPGSNLKLKGNEGISLSIRGCEDFSPGVLREFLDIFHDAWGKGRGLMKLRVEGRGPVLTKEDRRWFDENSNFVNVNWVTTNGEGISKVYSSGRMR